jgi:hypothetical protein
MSLIQLGERFTGRALIVGNAAFAFVWGIGGIVGSPATGLAMQLIGHQGLPSSLWPAVLCTGGVSDGGETAGLIEALASCRVTIAYP